MICSFSDLHSDVIFLLLSCSVVVVRLLSSEASNRVRVTLSQSLCCSSPVHEAVNLGVYLG